MTDQVHHHHHHHHVPAHVRAAIHVLFEKLKAHHPDLHDAHEAFKVADLQHEEHLSAGQAAAEAALASFATRGI